MPLPTMRKPPPPSPPHHTFRLWATSSTCSFSSIFLLGNYSPFCVQERVFLCVCSRIYICIYMYTHTHKICMYVPMIYIIIFICSYICVYLYAHIYLSMTLQFTRAVKTKKWCWEGEEGASIWYVCVTWRTDMCLWHDELICVTWLVISHAYLWHDLWCLVYSCDVTSYVSFVCVTWLSMSLANVCDMACYVWHIFIAECCRGCKQASVT